MQSLEGHCQLEDSYNVHIQCLVAVDSTLTNVWAVTRIAQAITNVFQEVDSNGFWRLGGSAVDTMVRTELTLLTKLTAWCENEAKLADRLARFYKFITFHLRQRGEWKGLL